MAGHSPGVEPLRLTPPPFGERSAQVGTRGAFYLGTAAAGVPSPSSLTSPPMARDHEGARHTNEHLRASDTLIPSCEPRRVRLVLRDQRVVDGQVHLPDGLDLATFLGSRDGGWVNLTDVCWQATGEHTPHVVLKVGLVLWAGAIDADTPLGPRYESDSPRDVEIMLENRITLRAELPVPTHRLTDVLEAYGRFIPLWGARMAGGEIAFGDVVVNRDAIHLVQDIPTASSPRSAALVRRVAAMPAGLGPDDASWESAPLNAAGELVVDPFRPVTLTDLEVVAEVRLPAGARDATFDPVGFHLVPEPTSKRRA